MLSGSNKNQYKNLSLSWPIGNDLINFFKMLLLLSLGNSQITIFSILKILWCCHCICGHMFRLNFGAPLCWCSLLTYMTWFTGLRIGVTVTVVIQQSWLHDQGLQIKAWIMFYYDCIFIMKLFDVRKYCLMYIFSYMILSSFLMVSESPGCDNPCGISKAFLSAAVGLRLSISYCFVWLGKFLTVYWTICRILVDQLYMIDMPFNEDN